MLKKVATLGQLGVNKDLQSQELPDNAFSDCMNVRFRNGSLQRMKGEQKIFDTPAVTPYWLQPYYSATQQFLVHAGLNAVYADTYTAGVPTRTNITPTVAPTGGVDDRWTGGVLNGVLVMNNGKPLCGIVLCDAASKPPCICMGLVWYCCGICCCKGRPIASICELRGPRW